MTQYLYGNISNPFQVTASRAPDNVLTVYYYDDYNALYALERGGVRYYVGSDHLGTPKVITDNTGNIVRQLEYDSWGVKISDTNAAFDLPIGFAGGIPDDATGLVRFGFRDYEPGTGRWTAKDPIFFDADEFNLYVYSLNDPVNLTDPEGMFVGEGTVGGFIIGGPPGAIIGGLVGAACGAVAGQYLWNTYFQGKGERNWEKGKGDDPLWGKTPDQLRDIEKGSPDPDERNRARKIRKQKEKKGKR